MPAVFLCFRPLPNVGIQHFGMWGIIWRKHTEDFKNPSPIAEWRTGKPAMITLKIQLDCSTVHYTTLWANIFVRSHLECGNRPRFQFNLTLKILSITPQNNTDLNQGLFYLWSKIGYPSLNRWWVMTQTNLVIDGRTQATKIPGGHYWPWVMRPVFCFLFIISIHILTTPSPYTSTQKLVSLTRFSFMISLFVNMQACAVEQAAWVILVSLLSILWCLVLFCLLNLRNKTVIFLILWYE